MKNSWFYLKMFEDLARNGVWGTCSECTHSDPAKCEFFERGDHKLTANDLFGLCERAFKYKNFEPIQKIESGKRCPLCSETKK